MPFDPSKPATNSPLASAEMRAQLTALNSDIQTRATNSGVAADIASTLAATSNNSNSVGTLGMVADSNYNPAQIQALTDKLDELINALRR